MKCTALVPLFFSAALVLGQNLVPNAGFDDLIDCPTERSQIYFAPPWTTASDGTPDLFNECSPNGLLQVPNAGIHYDSYQPPRSGGGYAGIVVFYNYNADWFSEYLQVPLNEPLKANKSYYLRFYVSPDRSPSEDNWIYTDAVGLALSDTMYYKDLQPHEVIPLEPVIENRGQIITDTAGWTKISGCYTANGSERYAIIGNFRTEDETEVVIGNPNYSLHGNNFYIEDVLITPFDPLPDTILLCDGMPEELNAGFLDATYLWNTGGTDSVITISQSGQYTIEAFIENCTLRDTVMVLDTRETDNFPSDTVICRDEPLRLSPPLPGEYQWSDGSQGSEIVITSSGNYAVSVTNECGEFIFSTKVEAEDCACNIYVPNAFSPNGDGINDFLEVYVGCDFEYEMKRFGVFDRWGGQVYTSGADEAPAWDGSARGKPLAPGIYVWFLEFETLRNGVAEKHLEKGEVSVVR
jgi:gliding motility-associated-like protein